MSDAEKAYQATPASTLEEQIMNPCIAKNEREWWAAAEIERLNRELDDVWDALAIQREDNASFGDAFKRQAAEIERLRAALEEIEQVALSYVHMKYAKLARAALTQEKPND